MDRTRNAPTGRVDDLKCPRCSAAISANDVNVDLMVALCRSCNGTVELARAQPRASQRDRPPDALLELMAPPRGLMVREEGETLIIRWRWFEWSASLLFVGFFTVFWNGFLVFWYAIALSNLGQGGLCMAVFPVLHVATGIGLAYWLIARLVNVTQVSVTPTHLTVAHGPLWWPSPEPVPVRSIDQLFVIQEDGSPVTYSVAARRPNRTQLVLFGVSNDLWARFLEQRLEAHLGFTDEPVQGEYAP